MNLSDSLAAYRFRLTAQRNSDCAMKLDSWCGRNYCPEGLKEYSHRFALSDRKEQAKETGP